MKLYLFFTLSFIYKHIVKLGETPWCHFKGFHHFLHFGCVPVYSHIFSFSLPLSLTLWYVLILSLTHSHFISHFVTLYSTLTISDTCGIHNWAKAFRSCYRKLAQVGFNHWILQLHWSIRPWVQLAFTQFWLCSDIFWYILTLTLSLTITISLSLSHPQTLSLALWLLFSFTFSL